MNLFLKIKKEYIEYLYEIINNNELGITYKGLIDKNKLDLLQNIDDPSFIFRKFNKLSLCRRWN